MAISVIGTPQAAGVASGADVTLTFSTAPSAGDVVVVFGGHFNRAASSVGPSTAGYASIVNDVASNPFISVAYKLMGETPDTTVVCYGTGNAADAAAYGCFVLRGIDIHTFQDATATPASGSSTNPDAVAIVTTTNNAWVLDLALSIVNDGSPGTVSGYTNTVSGNANDTNAATVAGATKLIATAASENPGTWSSWATGVWKTVTVAARVMQTYANSYLVQEADGISWFTLEEGGGSLILEESGARGAPFMALLGVGS